MLKMNEQEIYQKIGELLWSIMPNEAIEIYFITPISTLNKLFKLNRRITTFFIHNDADRM